MNENQIINLELTVTETNGVLHALGQLPFAQVAGLVQKIQQQAAPQVAPVTPTAPAAPE